MKTQKWKKIEKHSTEYFAEGDTQNNAEGDKKVFQDFDKVRYGMV